MASTATKLSLSWVKVSSNGAAFTLQVGDGYAEVVFLLTVPDAFTRGFILNQGQGLNQDYGTGDVYARGRGYVVVMS